MLMLRCALAPGGTLLLKDFDATMSRHAAFAGFHIPTVDELRAALHGLDILHAEVVDTPAHHHGNEEVAAEQWTAAWLVARRPAP